MNRRQFLRIFVIGAPALAAACQLGDYDSSLPGDCYDPAGCSPMSAESGLNQYDLLAQVYEGDPPTDRRFEFKVLRDGEFVSPDLTEFVTGPAPEGAATDRSYDPNHTELYFFKDGETVIFYEVFEA